MATDTTTTYVTISSRDRAETVTVPVHRLAETLHRANPELDAEATEAVNGLAEAIATGQSTWEYARQLGIDVRVNVEDAVDIGPAPTAPAWCLPDTLGSWEKLGKEYGELPVCTWTRDIDGEYSGVWIKGDDQIIDGRIMRGAPRVALSDAPFDGWTASEARQIAAALLNAADILDEFNG